MGGISGYTKRFGLFEQAGTSAATTTSTSSQLASVADWGSELLIGTGIGSTLLYQSLPPQYKYKFFNQLYNKAIDYYNQPTTAAGFQSDPAIYNGNKGELLKRGC